MVSCLPFEVIVGLYDDGSIIMLFATIASLPPYISKDTDFTPLMMFCCSFKILDASQNWLDI